MDVYVKACKQKYSTQFSEEIVTDFRHKSFESGHLELDHSSSFYPNRGDEKLMRSDTIAAVILVNELLEAFEDDLDREEMGLFVASGVFIENIEQHLGHLIQAFETIKDAKDEPTKLATIFRVSPPLLALKTLTNSTMSFVAQYCGIKGNNTTFGTTSLAGFHAIEQAVNEVIFKNKNALALASNVGGEYSFLVNSTLFDRTHQWKESAAIGAVLLGNEKEGGLCKITQLKNEKILPNLRTREIKRNWKMLLPDFKADALLFSGAYTLNVFEDDLAYCKEMIKESRSSFLENGNMGASNLLSAISDGLTLIQQGAQIIDLVDRDSYGRESFIRLESVK